MYNFRYNIKSKGISSYKRHNKNTEPPFPLYVAVKLSSSCRLKTLVNWLYFCAGTSLPYKSLFELTRDIANRMISQYNRDGAFLTWSLKNGILTIIAKDNMDQNSKSTTIYFPVSNRREPWYSSRVWSSRKLGWSVEYRSSLKIDALPSSYICVKIFRTPLQTLTLPSKLPPTPFPTTPDSDYRNGISDELAWV